MRLEEIECWLNRLVGYPWVGFAPAELFQRQKVLLCGVCGEHLHGNPRDQNEHCRTHEDIARTMRDHDLFPLHRIVLSTVDHLNAFHDVFRDHILTLDESVHSVYRSCVPSTYAIAAGLGRAMPDPIWRQLLERTRDDAEFADALKAASAINYTIEFVEQQYNLQLPAATLKTSRGRTMSYCRFGRYSDVYVLGTYDDRIECCGCELLHQRQGPFPFRSYCATAESMIEHLNDHVAHGHKVLHYAFERLRIEACADRLIARGYERKDSRWQLPRQLGLTIVARTDYRWRGPYPEDNYPADYHCVAIPETWVESWAECIAELPLPITERRRVLSQIARNPVRTAAIKAAQVAQPDLPTRIILDIASAEV